MSTFHFRDARKQLLLEALAVLGDQPNDLRDPLQQELDAIQQDSWLVADKTYLIVGADWLWSFSLTLKMTVDADPVLLALGRPARISAAQAGAIESIPHGPGGPPADYIDQVRAAVDSDELIFSELLFAAHHDWIVQPADSRPYPFDDVGVLLPVRLETLFDMPNTEFNNDPTRWKLSLRVIPDEASICRNNRFVSNDERTVVTAFWNTIRQTGTADASWLDGERATVAWQQLAAQVTPARAAWLVANLPTALEGDRIVVTLPADMPVDTQPNCVGGFPPEMHVMIDLKEEVDGEFQKTVGRLPQDPDKMIDTKALTLPLPSKAETKRQQWWNNWKQAIEIGVAGEFPLPQGVTPENINAIYVVGIGDEAPLAHFKTQVDSGELAILPLGVPTNTIHGKAAADLGKSAEDWRKIAQQRLRQRADSSFNPFKEAGINLQRHLLGAETLLPFFPTGDIDDDTLDSQHMAQALWPALWGYWLRDLWQMGDNAFRVGKWMTENFYPEGPLMPLRISDQPYGILPVTQLAAWQTLPTFHQEAETQAALESAMADLLVRIRAEWQTLTKDKRSIVGKNSAEFMQLLGQNALSRRYLQREFSPVWVQRAPYISRISAMGLDPEQFLNQVSEFYKLPLKRLDLAGLEPAEYYLTNGYWQPQELPLVQPTAMIYQYEKTRIELRQLFAHIFDWPFGQGDGSGLDLLFQEHGLHVLPDSLLIRLLTYATQLAAPWNKPPTTSAQGIVVGAQKESLFSIAKELDQESWRSSIKDEETGEVRRYTMMIPDQRRRQLERALRATLDSAATRIDPWMVGFAWQRLKTQSQGLQHNHRLGVYGWVDGPFQGTPGPTDAGRLHTPSYNQTLAALILRDKFLTAKDARLTNDAGSNSWTMNISSARARLAEEIADEVRMGFHIYEVVGRHVENIVGDHQQVKALRIHPQYAMRPERQDVNEVCNGIEALLGLLNGNWGFQLSDKQILALQQLHDALDCYSDLLVADGVMQLVNRQVDRAAETLDAAAGFSRPPSFEFLRTPPSGYLLESVVISALPYVTTNETESSPIRLAEPSLAAYLDQHLAGEWQWQAKDAAGNLLGTVSLAELGFVPHETIALTEDFFKELAQRKLGLEQTVEIVAPRQLTMAQEIAAALGNRPAAGRDFSSKSTVQQAIDLAVYEELRMRFEQLWEKCALLVDQLQNAADDIIRADLLLQAIRWGVIPISTEGYDLRLRSVTEIDKIDDQGQSLVIIALVGTDLHIRIFDAHKTRIVDKSEAELVDLPDLTVTAFKQRLTPFPRVSALSQADKQAMINNASLLAGHTPDEAADREVLFALLLGQSVSGSATKRLAVNMGKVLQGRLSSAPEIDAVPTHDKIATPLANHAKMKRDGTPDGIASLARAIANLATPNSKLTILACWDRTQLLDDSKVATAQVDPSLEESWLTVVAATRANLARLEALQLEMDRPFSAWSNSPGDPWQQKLIKANRERRDTEHVQEKDETPLGLRYNRFVAVYGPNNAWTGEKVAVGMIDAYSEAIPMPQRTSTAAFGFNAPSARAPQAILLAVPPRPRQRLDATLLRDIVAETRQSAHARMIRVEDLGDYHALTPTMWLQSSGPNRVYLQPGPIFE